MFDLPKETITFAQRMQGHRRSAQQVAVSPAELDMFVETVFIPLFRNNGLSIGHEKTSTGHTLTINYTQAIEATPE